MGYKADYEGYGDELDFTRENSNEYNYTNDSNQMNFMSQRQNNYMPLRRKPNHIIHIRGSRAAGQPFQKSSQNRRLHIDVPKNNYDYNNDADYTGIGGPSNQQNYDDQIPDEYKNDPELYRAIKASLQDLDSSAAA